MEEASTSSYTPMIRLCTLNVRGLRNTVKRNKIFAYIKAKNIDIALLQETHGTPEIEEQWAKEWGSPVFYSHFNSKSRGVMIMSSNKLNVSHIANDNHGRYLAVTCLINENKITIVNIYAPNSENEQITFFRSVRELIANQMISNELIIAGDFNVHLENIDKKGGQPTVKRSRAAIELLITDNNLTDIWRSKHPNEHSYTWEQETKGIMCRLDYFLISKAVTKIVKTCKITTSIQTDHKMVIMEIDSKITNNRGPGLWKFNNSLLDDHTYCKKVHEVIATAWENDTQTSEFKWEYLKFNIQTTTIQYSKQKARLRRELEHNITEQMDALYKIKCEDSLTTVQETEYQSLMRVLEELIAYKEHGAKIRSKIEFIEQNEKSNKFFYNQEHKAFERKTITTLTINDEQIEDEKRIREELHKYYQELFTSKITSDTFPQHIENQAKCNDNDRKECDKKLTTIEAYAALLKMNKGKSPGSDGLTVEFYSTFWDHIGPKLVETLNESNSKSELPTSLRRGVITLLHKRNKDPLLIKNWRPVSLLNVDYKLFTKCLAVRVQSTISSLIHYDQKGFIKGRYIGENIRQIEDTLEYTNKKDKTGILLLMDFEKAFDSIEWKYMDKVLEVFNFGQEFRRLVKLCYTNNTSTIMNNGFSSGWFKVSRGVRQGCPLSGYLFLLCIEILAQLIRNDKDIVGLRLLNTIIKLSLFADDASCFVEDEQSIKYIFECTEKFSQYSGLKLNLEKSQLVYLGPWKTKSQVIHGIAPCMESFNALGIELGHEKAVCYTRNITEKIGKMKQKLGIWSIRSLSLLGKVLIAKSFGMSNLIYSLSNVDCSIQSIKEAQQNINKFIWNHKPAKIRHNVLSLGYDQWGIRAPDLLIMQKSLRLAWIGRLLKNKSRTIDQELESYGGICLLLHCNYDYKKLELPEFYRAIFEFFREIHDQSKYRGIVWNNKEILVNKKTIYIEQWAKNGVKYLKDLVKQGKVISKIMFEQKYSLANVDKVTYSSIQTRVRKMIKTNDPCLHDDYNVNIKSCAFPFNDEILSLELAKCKDYYSLFIKTKQETPSAIQYWNNLGLTNEKQQLESFAFARKACKESLALSYQYRLIHNVLPTNENLKRWRIRKDDNCEYCNQPETLVHMFIECPNIQRHISEISKSVKNEVFTNALNDKDTMIFGTSNIQVNRLLMITKAYLFESRLQSKTLDIKRFENELAIRMYSDSNKLSETKFDKKWSLVSHLSKDLSHLSVL